MVDLFLLVSDKLMKFSKAPSYSKFGLPDDWRCVWTTVSAKPDGDYSASLREEVYRWVPRALAENSSQKAGIPHELEPINVQPTCVKNTKRSWKMVKSLIDGSINIALLFLLLYVVESTYLF